MLGFTTSSLSPFDNSHKLQALNVSHHQGELVKETVDGNAEEDRVFSSPPTKIEEETASEKDEGSVQVSHPMRSCLHFILQCLSPLGHH